MENVQEKAMPGNFLKFKGKHTNPNVLLAFAFAIVATVFTYFVILPLLRNASPYIYAIFCQRGYIPPGETFFFWWAVFIIILKYRAIRQESAASENLEGYFGDGKIDSKRASEISQKLQQNKGFILADRIDKGLQYIKSTNSTEKVDEVMSQVADIDANIVENSYSLIKYLIWALPILGFLGTVIGISGAIGQFTTIFASALNFKAVQDQMGGITDDLAAAFDTTLLALVMSGIVMFVTSLLQKREEDMLSEIDEFCIDNLISKLDVPVQAATVTASSESFDYSELRRYIADLNHSIMREQNLLQNQAILKQDQSKMLEKILEVTENGKEES